MSRVIVGVDPHKKSVTIEAIDEQGKVLSIGRFGTTTGDYQAMLGQVRRQWPRHRWAIEGAQGAGRPLAQRLLADGETVVDVPAKLAARVRVFDTGNARKTDATDAHAVAAAALRGPKLRVLAFDEELVALRLLTDRRDELSARRVQTVNRLHRLLAELIAGGAGKDLTATKAKRMLARVKPRSLVGKTTRRMAVEEVADLVATDAKLKAFDQGARRRGPGTRVAPDGVARDRPRRRRADLGRRRGCGAVPGPEPLRVLDRDRTPGCFLRRAHPAPPFPSREPTAQPRAAHGRHRPDPARHRRASLLPPQAGPGQDPHGGSALPQASALRHGLSPARCRRQTRRARRRACRAAGHRGGPGRALGGVTDIQRGRPAHPGRGLFGTATTRTRSPHATGTPPIPDSARGSGSPAPAPARRSRQVERPTGRTTLTATSAGAHSSTPNPRS